MRSKKKIMENGMGKMVAESANGEMNSECSFSLGERDRKDGREKTRETGNDIVAHACQSGSEQKKRVNESYPDERVRENRTHDLQVQLKREKAVSR